VFIGQSLERGVKDCPALRGIRRSGASNRNRHRVPLLLLSFDLHGCSERSQIHSRSGTQADFAGLALSRNLARNQRAGQGLSFYGALAGRPDPLI